MYGLKAAMVWMAITKNDFLANQTVVEPSKMLELPIWQPSFERLAARILFYMPWWPQLIYPS